MPDGDVNAHRRIPRPAWDVINQLALRRCTDETHSVRFRRGSEITRWTLAELDQRAVNLARRLHATGVRVADRVGVLSTNRIEWVLLDLAVLKLGGVTVAVEPGRFEPERVVEKYGLRRLFAEGETSRDAVQDIDSVLPLTEPPGNDVPELPAFAGYDEADICQIKQTSGSTGTPRGIETTAVSVNSSISEVQELFRHGDGDNILVLLPLWFLQQRWWFYSALVFGHDVALSGYEDAVEMAQAVSPSVVMGVPRLYDDLRARIRASGAPVDLPERRETIQALLGGRIRYLWTGSAPATRATLEFFNDAEVPLYEGYGLNETCIVAKNHPGAFRLGSVGQVLPNKTIRFDRDGVLVIASHHPVNTRYTWCNPGDNQKVWLPTGEIKTYDLGHVDDDGFLWIHGRVDDVISPSAGPNVLLPPIETLLRGLPGVHECAAYGRAVRFLTAIVSPTPDLDPAVLSDRIVALNETLRPEQRIHAVIVAAEQFSVRNGLLNTQFKLKRRQIEERFARELELVYDKHNGDAAPPVPPVLVFG
ncbi:AMP-binding protein [Micromonospora matsumotoense]|uniref:AMP-binding protein n=1 Tax=Micromonospora matsumotoense TaxID=121616 RepID=UPI00341F429A